MGAVFAAAARAPITEVPITFELTGDYRVIPPPMIAIVVATALADTATRRHDLHAEAAPPRHRNQRPSAIRPDGTDDSRRALDELPRRWIYSGARRLQRTQGGVGEDGACAVAFAKAKATSRSRSTDATARAWLRHRRPSARGSVGRFARPWGGRQRSIAAR